MRRALRRLASSSKALVVLVILFGIAIAVSTGRASFAEASELIKYIIGPWLLAVGIEDAALKFSSRRVSSVTANATVTGDKE